MAGAHAETFRLSRTKRADEDLSLIIEYSDNHYPAQQSERFLSGLKSTIDALSISYNRYPIYSGSVRRAFYEPFWIYYQIHPRLKLVRVLRIYHKSRRPLKI